MNVGAIIQVRTCSTRLPGKIFKNILGRPILWHFVKRVKKSKLIDKIVIATTTKKRDDIVVEFAKEENIDFYRGDENDVLDRFYQAASLYNIDVIVRVTPDCPLIDPRLVDRVIKEFLMGKYDYASNTIKRTFPDGLDIEVLSFRALEKAWKEAKLPEEREHVTPYIRRPGKFKIRNVENKKDLSELIFTLDYPEDLEFIKGVYEKLYPKKKIFLTEDVLNLLDADSQLKGMQENLRKRSYI